MPINPALIDTIRVDQLPAAAIANDSIIPHAIGELLYQASLSDLIGYLRPLLSTAIQYEIRDLWVDEAYVIANFESTGIGKNLCIGWAICDGRNGTPTSNGRVNVAQGISSFGIAYELKDSGGAPTHTLNISEIPSHNHGLEEIKRNTNNSSGTPVSFYDQGAGAEPHGKTTDNIGGGSAHNNMQPYLVFLRIMKL